MYKFSKSSLDTLYTVYGPLQALVISVLSNSPHDFGIPDTGGKRTSEEQNKLFKKNWSKLDGYSKKSYHQTGMAIDIFVYDEHGVCYKCKDKYNDIADIFFNKFDEMKAIGIFPKKSYLRWGNDWNKNGIPVDLDPDEHFQDLPHFELRNIT